MNNAERIDRLARDLAAVAQQRGYCVSGDWYCPEEAAAELIGVELRTLRNWRTENRSPRYRRLGGPRGRVWYSLTGIARFLTADEGGM